MDRLKHENFFIIVFHNIANKWKMTYFYMFILIAHILSIQPYLPPFSKIKTKTTQTKVYLGFNDLDQ